MNSDFQAPPARWSVLAAVGGVVTAIAAIAGLEHWSHHLARQALGQNLQLSAFSIQTPIYRSPATIEAERLLEQKVDWEAAACNFDQRLIPNTGMTFEVKTFNSLAMGRVRSYGLILPPGYNAHPQAHYPVVFLLHGGHGDAGGWQACGAVVAVLDKLYKNGSLPPTVVITPDGNDNRGSSRLWDPEYFDGSHGRVATLIGSDLVQEVKSRYRVLNDPKFWALGGMSSGGWGALNIGLRYLNHFQILFSESGYFVDPSGPQNSPQNLVQKLSPAQRESLRVYLDVGTRDQKFLNSTEQFHHTLLQLGIPHAFYVFPGGHGATGADSGWHYWHKHITDSLTYVGQQWKSLQM